MNIVQVCPRYYPDVGGVEKIVQEINERLVGRRHKVEVVTTDPTGMLPKHETINGVEIVRFRSFAPGDAYFFAPGMYSYLKRVDCDVIHAHNYHALPAMMACLAKGDRKFIISPYYHGKGHTVVRKLLFNVYNRIFGKYFFSNAGMIISPSDFEIEMLNKDFNLDEISCVTIAPGVDEALFGLSGSSELKKNRSILFVGRIEKYKGLQYVIKALEYISNEKGDHFILNVVGSGPYKDRLQKIAAKSKVEIIWHGRTSQEQLRQLYQGSELLVLLSSFETFGIVVAEALAARLPALVVKSSALKEFVDERVCFSVDDPADAEELGDKILEICDLEIDFSGLTDKKVRSWDKVVDEYERVYMDICE
ncbi:MAG: glycosyltransferase family 4 protein [ANME-2 cluster archaeon]|nr:glycosyltransferase family 4 protein [ANME-2 cluster archaeon]